MANYMKLLIFPIILSSLTPLAMAQNCPVSLIHVNNYWVSLPGVFPAYKSEKPVEQGFLNNQPYTVNFQYATLSKEISSNVWSQLNCNYQITGGTSYQFVSMVATGSFIAGQFWMPQAYNEVMYCQAADVEYCAFTSN